MGSYQKPRVRATFPLSWHSGRGLWYAWVKDSEGKKKQKYFGADPVQAERAWREFQPSLDVDGAIISPSRPDQVTVADVCREFMQNVTTRFNTPNRRTGKPYGMDPATLSENHRVAVILAQHCGESPVDQIHNTDLLRLLPALGNAPSTVWRRITIVRSIFKHGARRFKTNIPDFGAEYSLPTLRERQRARVRDIPIFQPEHVRAMLHHSTGYLRAGILLGINAGFYSKCCSDLLLTELDGEFYRGTRYKSGNDRMAWLWPETRQAVAAEIERTRRNYHIVTGIDDEPDRVFLTAQANHMVRLSVSGQFACTHCKCSYAVRHYQPGATLCRECGKTTSAEDVVLGNCRHSRKDNFYDAFSRLRRRLKLSNEFGSWKSLRHTYATVADTCASPIHGHGVTDRHALKLTLGHLGCDVTDLYIRSEWESKVKNVGQHVRAWLWGRACGSCAEICTEPGNVWTCECGHVNREFQGDTFGIA